MRGTAYPSEESLEGYGITPAHAGNRNMAHGFLGHEGDHPRACGEQFFLHRKEEERLGSPPRMRGTVPLAADGSDDVLDHPRACGEQAMAR